MEQPPAELVEDADFYRWYGTWSAYKPAEVARRFAGMPAPWWVIGGWAIEAFTSVPREHDDIDVAFFRDDLPAVLAHLAPDHCVWTNLSGTIRPLRKPEDLLEGSRQLWVRPNSASPWVMDLAMTPHKGDIWMAPRDLAIERPLDEATFVGADGIRYLRPELVLFMKARWARWRDDRDLEVTLPRLDDASRAWLRESIALAYPGHRWLDSVR